MTKVKNRIIQLPEISVERAFEKEAELLQKIQSGNLDQCLLVWHTTTPTVVLPASKKWQATPELINQLKAENWHVLSRRTGGAPVPQVEGVINLSHMYAWDSDKTYAIQEGYENFCRTLDVFFNSLGIQTKTHATPHSYCDGDYNMNIDGKKVVGTAQRVINGKERKVVLAQACILVEADLKQLIHPINLSNKLNQIDYEVKAGSHTCIADHLETLPSIKSLYQNLVQAFTHTAN